MTPLPGPCPECGLYGGQYEDGVHLCLVYDGPPCTTPGCGLPTVVYTVGAPGYGTGRSCRKNHNEPLSPQGILTLADVI